MNRVALVLAVSLSVAAVHAEPMLPTYGNYGGLGWSAGRYWGENEKLDRELIKKVKPVDSLDSAFLYHDLCYDGCNKDGGCRNYCDRDLVKQLKSLKGDPRTWSSPPADIGYAGQYRDAAIDCFDGTVPSKNEAVRMSKCADIFNHLVCNGRGDYNKAVQFLIACKTNNRAQCDMAIKEFNCAELLSPNNEWVYLNRGDTYRFLGYKALAMRDYDKAITVNPRSGNAYYYRGNLYFQDKDYARAINDYTSAIENGYGFTRVYHARGDAFSRQQKWSNAVEDYSKAISQEPDKGLFHALRGEAHENAGNLRDAFNDDTKAISLGFENAVVYYNRAAVRIKLGMENAGNRSGVDEVVHDFEKAASLDASMAPMAYFMIGSIYDRSGINDLARKFYKKAVAVDPEGPTGSMAKEELKRTRGR